jgi:hypothetical protein
MTSGVAWQVRQAVTLGASRNSSRGIGCLHFRHAP